MGLVEKRGLISQLSPPIDHLLATQLVDEFISMERRFIQRDWGPAELDGGQFCEVLARILYHQDSGNLSANKPLDDCLRYVENEQVIHSISPRHHLLHLARVVRTVYKFRSQRGAVHISTDYTPNHMDSKIVVECVRWAFAETLRIFSQRNQNDVAKIIRELLQFDVPCIGSFEDEILVQRTDLKAEEEILLLLHYAGEAGFSRNEVGKYARCSPSSVTNSLQKLSSPAFREVIQLCSNGNYRLTDLGARRIRERLAEKLLLQ